MIAWRRHRQAAQEVLTLLDRQRKALRGGDGAAIAAVAAALGPATAALEALPPSDDAEFHGLLARLGAAAEHNRRLADAGRRGFEAARRLRAELETTRAQLNTYTGDGARRDLATSRVTRDKRA